MGYTQFLNTFSAIWTISSSCCLVCSVIIPVDISLGQHLLEQEYDSFQVYWYLTAAVETVFHVYVSLPVLGACRKDSQLQTITQKQHWTNL